MNQSSTSPKLKSRIKIFPKILISFLVVPLITIAGLFYVISSQEEERKATVERELILEANILTNQVDDWVDKNLRLSRYLVNIDAFQSMAPDAQKPLLEKAKRLTEWMTVIFTVDTNGDAVARNDSKPLRNYADRQYFADATSNKGFGEQVIIGKNYPFPLHCFAIPVARDFSVVGVLIQCSKLSDISNSISGLRVGDTGYAILLDKGNRLIAHGRSHGELEGALSDYSEKPELDNAVDEQVYEYYDENGIHKIAYTQKTKLGWRVILQQDYDEAYRLVQSNNTRAISLLIVCIFLTLLLSYILSKGITNPINQLTAIAVEVSKGKRTDAVPGLDRGDELGELARAVARLKNSIEIAIKKLRKRA